MFERVAEILIRQWEYDVWVFSQPWLYIPLLVPAIFYLIFFSFKWATLTAPLWLPVHLICSAFSKDSEKQNDDRLQRSTETKTD